MRKFANQFLALFIGLFLLLSMGVVFYTNQLVRNSTTQTIVRNVEERATNIAALLDEWILQSATSVQTAVEDFPSMNFLLDEKDSIAFMTPDGTLVYSSNAYQSSAENQKSTKEVRSILEGERIGTSGIVLNRKKEREYRVAVALFNGKGEKVGILRLTHDMGTLDELEDTLQQSVFVFSFISIVLASFIALHLTNRISRPLKRIESQIDRIAEGDYSDVYMGEDYPEVMELGHTVNKLADSLEEKNYAILHSNERLTALLDRLIVGVVLLDENQEIQVMNPAVHKLLDINNELVGHSFLELAKSYGLIQVIQQTYQKKANQNAEVYIYYPTELILDVNTMVLPDSQHNQVLVLLYDITEIRRLEKVRSDFVANASHELRTPITALKGFAEVLLDGAMEDPALSKQFVEIIQKEARRLEILVNDILELSRVERKQVPMSKERVVLREVVEACFEVICPQAKEKNISLRIFSNTPEPVIVEGERSRIEQVLNNLIFNAVNYTDKGGKVSVMLEQTSEEAVIHVVDTGIGIPEGDINRIFERFYRVDKARSRNSGGTGLGLSIVRNLVENMNGSISVKSTLGLGSTFTVKLPKNGNDYSTKD
ncbi:two-component system histidine kinase PnpS [Jeotgalibaca caeni]|uniref:two-component system histidine kinase PnpS n=1 Tax=Jeotgalibaca caeni TaxID=3028623 RepID=UPI00237EC6F8|nr:ATP-binding protein [Jeotgalibaca caeni]MDE1547734.1 ATP-binding protein [Jeotgalibaca caeni]